MGGINPVNFDGTTCNMGMKMVIFEPNMLCVRMKFGSRSKLNTAFIIYEYGRMCDSIAKNQLGSFREILK